MSGPLTLVGPSPEVRALFAGFSQVDDPVVSEFISSMPERFSDAANHLASQRILVSDIIMQNRMMLKSFIKKFHSEAGTLTDAVRSNIELLDDSATRIFVSTHQPNLFAYGGVFKKIVLLETLKTVVERDNKGSRAVNLFLVVDHDFVDEPWVRLAQLPSIQHSSGIMELRLPVSESMRWKMVCNMPVPSHRVVNNWKSQIRSWIKKNALDKNKKIFLDNLDQFWQQVETSYARAVSYADLNSFLMSKVINGTWNYGTLFVRLSEMQGVFGNGFEFLISNSDKYSEALRFAESEFRYHGINTGVSSSSHLNAPVWLHCSCGSKGSVKIAKKGPEILLAGYCISCKKEMELNIGNFENLTIGKNLHNMSPRAIPIPLLLSRDLAISSYASGVGGIGYLVDGVVVAKKLGLAMPLVLVWPSRDVYNGIAQSRALAFMPAQDIDLYLQSLKDKNAEYEKRIIPVLSRKAEKVRAAEPISDLLAQLFQLKKEQRRIRQQINDAEKIMNAVNLSPCLVDYAVNFGLARLEETWRNHLIKDGGLASPITF